MLTPEEMFEKPIGGDHPEDEFPHWCGNILYGVVAFLQKIITRYRVHGDDTIRALHETTGIVIAPTHKSYLDVSFVWCALRPKLWPRMMARDKLFEKNALVAQLMARCGAFPVARDSADRTAVKRAARMLKNREIVCIFPEGTRRGKSGKEPTLHAGAALIARMGKAPLIPAAARNCEKVKQKGEFFIHFPTVDVCFGSPVYVSWFDFLPKAERLDACIWYVMRESFAIDYACPPEEVDMAALFPEAKDYAAVFAEHPVGVPGDEGVSDAD